MQKEYHEKIIAGNVEGIDQSRPESLSGSEKVKKAAGIRAVAVTIALITLIIYLPALNGTFVDFDDPEYVYKNIHIRSINSDFLQWIFQFHSANWHPLTWLSHAFDYAVWELDPWGHHLSSILLHSANTFLLCILTINLILNAAFSGHPNTQEYLFKRALIAGGITSLLFGIIPVHVESVAWVSERKDVLSTFFVLLSIISYAAHVRAQGTAKRTEYYALSFICFIFALMSKPMAVTLPFVLLTLDIYPFHRLSFGKNLKVQKRVLIEKVPFLFLSCISAIVTLMAQHSGGLMKSLETYPFSSRIVVAFRSLWFYLGKIFFPMNLSPYYPYPRGISILSFEFLFSVVVAALISVLCIHVWRKGAKIFLMLWVFYIVTLLPVLGIIQVGAQAAADRYTYIPSIGPLFLVGLATALLIERSENKPHPIRSKAAVFAVMAIFVCFSGWKTIRQIDVWKNSTTMLTAMLKTNKNHAQLYHQRAQNYMQSGEYAAALRDLTDSIKLDPNNPQAYYNRAVVHVRLNKHAEALRDMEDSLRLDPTSASVYRMRAFVYGSAGDYKKSIEDLNRAFQYAPASIDLYLQRGIAHVKSKNYKKAIGDISRVIDSIPSSSTAYPAYYYRSVAYHEVSNIPEAIRDLSRAIEIKPDNVEAYYKRGLIYYSQGEFNNALKDFSDIIALYSDNAAAYIARANVYYKMDKNAAAIQDFQQAARLGDTKSQEFLRAQGIKW